jgi:uncharacterized membrane protein YkoI
MRYFKILPAAASIIALTSVAFFAQDRRDLEERDASSERTAVHAPAGSTAANLVKVQLESKLGGIYLIEVELGLKTREVMIDAYTGKVLRKRDIPPGEA